MIGAGSASWGSPIHPVLASPCVLDRLDPRIPRPPRGRGINTSRPRAPRRGRSAACPTGCGSRSRAAARGSRRGARPPRSRRLELRSGGGVVEHGADREVREVGGALPERVALGRRVIVLAYSAKSGGGEHLRRRALEVAAGPGRRSRRRCSPGAGGQVVGLADGVARLAQRIDRVGDVVDRDDVDRGGRDGGHGGEQSPRANARSGQ